MADLKIGREKKIEECEKVCRKISETRKLFENEGLHPEIISGAGTGTYKYEYEVLSEIQAGSYIFMDFGYNKVAPEFDISLTLLTTVISTPSRNRAIIDAGLKAISTDHGMPVLKNIQGVECLINSEEHGVLIVNDPSIQFNIGDKVELYPSHCDTTVNLHDVYNVIRNGEIQTVWPITARGKFH